MSRTVYPEKEEGLILGRTQSVPPECRRCALWDRCKLWKRYRCLALGAVAALMLLFLCFWIQEKKYDALSAQVERMKGRMDR